MFLGNPKTGDETCIWGRMERSLEEGDLRCCEQNSAGGRDLLVAVGSGGEDLAGEYDLLSITSYVIGV